MAATIMEIAKRLNISHTTVSRVLNNKADVAIAEKTRQRVLRTAQEMGYAPNLAARSLRDARTHVVAVFGSSYAGMWGGITPELVRGIVRVLEACHYGIFYALSDFSEQNGRALSSWRFDGAIVLQSPTPSTLRRLAGSGRPFVCVNETIEGSSAVLCDEAGGVRMALDHLWDSGHRTIAYANAARWHLSHYSVVERHEAYCAYVAERGLAPVPGHDVIADEDDRSDFIRTAVIDRGVTAVLAYDHVVAARVMAAAHRLGLRIPQDFSLICFNDEFPVRDVFPPLTVVAPMGEAMGQRGGDLLLARMESPDPCPPSVIRFPEQLILRESTAPPRRTG
jgi:LacI family transcriptional regulator